MFPILQSHNTHWSYNHAKLWKSSGYPVLRLFKFDIIIQACECWYPTENANDSNSVILLISLIIDKVSLILENAAQIANKKYA